MNDDALKDRLVDILKKNDSKWFLDVAVKLDKAPDELTFADLAQVKFGQPTFSRVSTIGRITGPIEYLFGVCLPNSVQDKTWRTAELFDYLQARAKKPDVNLRLAQKRVIARNFDGFSFMILNLAYLLLLLPIFYYFWKTFGIVAVPVYVFLIFLALASYGYFSTHFHYSRVSRRIKAMRTK